MKKEGSISGDKRILKIITCVILILFSIEYLGYNNISVYRVGIFPLLIVGCLFISGKPKYNYVNLMIMLMIIYLFLYAFCLAYLGDNIMFPLFSIPLVYYFFSFWGLKTPIKIDYAKIFVWYSLPHIVSHILGDHNFHGTGRFMGLNNDPNFCGIFLVFSIVSAIFLLRRKKTPFYQIIIYSLLLFYALFLLFLTGSRGAMLSLLLLLFVEFWKSKINKIWKLSITILLVVFILRVYDYILTLPDWVSPDVSRIDSVLCRFKPDSMADGSNRTEQWAKILRAFEYQNSIFTPLGNNNVGMKGTYSHNTFIDFLIENGVFLGTIFLCSFLFAIIETIRKSNSIRLKSPEEWEFLYISYALMLQLFFLSAISQKIFWLSLIYIIFLGFRKSHLYINSFQNR